MMLNQSIPPIWKYLLVFPIMACLWSGCHENEISSEVPEDNTSGLKAVAENVLMQVSFESETTSFSQVPEGDDLSDRSEDVKHFVMTRAVPLIKKDKQIFTIYKDRSYDLIIHILNPGSNPMREAFREETMMNDWELQKIVINQHTITGYDGSGGQLFSEDNSQNPFFNALINKIFSDEYFASHVNIGNALFQVSGGAENYLDPKLRSFFVEPNAELTDFEGFLMIKQNIVDALGQWGAYTQDEPSPTSQLRTHVKDPEDESPEASYTLEETAQMIEQRAQQELAQRNPDDLNNITAIDKEKSELSAEVVHAGNEQVLSISTYEVDDDEQKTVKTKYTEHFETDPVHDVDLIHVESTTYSNVNVVNTLKEEK